MGKKKGADTMEFKPYSDYAHVSRKRRKTDNMTAQEILDHISDNL